ncbi:laccase [Mycena galopus ATCC 62051]|nr:laccase [Mycena galopus ATCC 62051]
MILFASCLLFSTFAGTHAAVGHSGSLEIVNKAVSPDGYSRSAVLVDGELPGPLITAEKGDRFQLNVVDKLTEADMLTDTSIHWHGLLQKYTNWADGMDDAEYPMTTGYSFLYDFETGDQADSHLSTQYCDGLRGPMVTYDPNDPVKDLYDIDDEGTVLSLSDWYHYNSLQAPKATTPLPNSTLINGLGRYENGPLSDLVVVNVSHGKRYRFRLVSMSCEPAWVFSIDGHSLNIIEVDSGATQPLLVDSIEIYPGQRYSFVLIATQEVSNYWIRACPLQNGMYQGFANGTNSAILRYAGAATQEPKSTTSTPVSKYPLVETALHPLVPTEVPGTHAPGAADVNLQFNITFNASIGRRTPIRQRPSYCRFSQERTHTAQELIPKGSLYELPRNKTIEISIPGAPVPPSWPQLPCSPQNWDNPVIRDVVSTGNSTDHLTTFRFRTDNAGPWILHCHIDWHLSIGLAVVLAEDIPGIETQIHPPVAWDQLCVINNSTA